MTMRGLNYPIKDELSYSTNEIDTGTTWINGSKIYKKTVNFGSLPNNTSKSVAHGISNINQIVRIEGYAFGTSGDITPLPYASVTSLGYMITLTANRANVNIHTGEDRSGLTGYITLYYTKVAS